MEVLAFFIFLITAFILLIALLAVSIRRYWKKGEISNPIFKFFTALMIYVPVTFYGLAWFGGFINGVIHKHVPTVAELTFCWLVVIIYGVIGFLLCAFVNGGFLKPWLLFSQDYNKPQTIFDSVEK